MARLIEVPSSQPLPRAVTVQAGDLLLFRASGGRVADGRGGVLEALGAFGAASLAPDGTVLAAAGGPDAVLFLARAPGLARIELLSGGAWGAPRRRRSVEVLVEA